MRKQIPCFVFTVLAIFIACRENAKTPSVAEIKEIGLKTGSVVLCGPDKRNVGNVNFDITGDAAIKKDFNFATALLHSFEYDEAEKVYAQIIKEDPGCAMAYWGVAMSNYHPLWAPPEKAELIKGTKALAVAKSLKHKSERESDYINALAVFYNDWHNANYKTRCKKYEQAMESLYKKYPGDKEAAIFYALALNAAADPADKSFASQKKAGEILNAIYKQEPGHPGIVHYIIHTYDYPALAKRALPAARQYATVAPASAHAQHMPSHIFVRLGLWDDCIQSNLASVSAAKCYAESVGIKGHWDEELHGLDYLEYGYLQKRDTQHAKQYVDYIRTIKNVQPANFKVAYALAAIPARYVLENKLWSEAAVLQTPVAGFAWEKFPWQEAMIHFARALGMAHTGNVPGAEKEVTIMRRLHEKLLEQKDAYQSNLVDIQLKCAEAWILWKKGNNEAALQQMELAADMEDKTEKHPVTPGELLPAREQLADMLMYMKRRGEALAAYRLVLTTHPNRYNALQGAEKASESENITAVRNK